MEYKTLKKELSKIVKQYNGILTFGEKKQWEKGCFLVSNYGFVSECKVEVESEIPSSTNWVSKSKGYWLRDNEGNATEYRNVIHWDCRTYKIVDVSKLFAKYGTVVLVSSDIDNNTNYGKHDRLNMYRVVLNNNYKG